MNKREKTISYIDAHREELFDFLKELIRRPSINPGDGSGGDEYIVQEFIAQALRAEGFDKVDVLSFTEDGKRPDVVGVRRGSGGGRSLAFNGHCDVVPALFPERWRDGAFNPTIRDGRLYGRGASDMKGALACMFFALKALGASGVSLRGDVIFQSVSGEESQQAEDIGTCRVLESGYKTDFAVCGEPTGNEIHISSSAVLFVKIVVVGKSAHISARNQAVFPQPAGLPSGGEVGVDAFRKSLPIVDYMNRLEVEWNHRYRDKVLGYGGKPTHDKQGVGVFTINPSFISGGEYLGTMPGRMEYTYAVWYPDRLVSKEALIKEIRAGVAAIASTDDWLKEHPPVVEAPVIQDWAGFRVPEEHEGVQCLMRACFEVCGGAVVSGFKAVCDATYLNRLGVPAVVCGPGALSNSVHGDEEFVELDKLVEAAKIYALFAIDWCGIDGEEGEGAVCSEPF